MHQSSLENMQKCYERFVKTRSWKDRHAIEVIDVGGSNVNGSYADIFSGPEFRYRAADISNDDTVDIVLEDPYHLPFDDESVDIVISGQAFEHVEFFWLLFSEMVRIVKPDGLIILIAPSGGPIHRYPVDCYRFYPDAYRALAKYCSCEALMIEHDQRGPWKDLVGVFSKNPEAEESPTDRIWETNRFEQETSPAPLVEKHPDPKVELLQGHTPYLEVMKRLHETLEPKTYLEIGIRHGRSLALAQCKAIGIDPEPDIRVDMGENHECIEMTSDYFFDTKASERLENKPVDLAFIDGMHLFEFALRDFINIEKHAGPSTVVVIDDVLPNHPVQAQRQRESAAWTGDIWKLVECLAEHRKDLTLTVLDTFPTGLLIVTGLKPKNRILTERYNPIVRKYKTMELPADLCEKLQNRKNAISPEDETFWENLKRFKSS